MKSAYMVRSWRTTSRSANMDEDSVMQQRAKFHSLAARKLVVLVHSLAFATYGQLWLCSYSCTRNRWLEPLNVLGAVLTRLRSCSRARSRMWRLISRNESMISSWTSCSNA